MLRTGSIHLFILGLEETIVYPSRLPSGVLFGHALHGSQGVFQSLASFVRSTTLVRQFQVLLKLSHADALQHAFGKVQTETIRTKKKKNIRKKRKKNSLNRVLTLINVVFMCRENLQYLKKKNRNNRFYATSGIRIPL